MPTPSRRVAGVATTLSAFTALCFVTTAPAHAASTTLTVSEVFGGGGNAGAPLRSDFVELYNTSTQPVDLSGWSVQYWSATGTTAQRTPLTGSVEPGHHFLVKEADGAGTSAPALDAPDAVGTIAMSATGGRVALVDPAGATVDLVGWGAATTAEGSPAPATTNATSVARTSDCTDTDDNAADFVTGAPTPQNTNAPATTCTPSGPTTPPETPTTTTIQQIQGSSHLSPLKDQKVTGVTGIVTAVTPTGFWMQAPSDHDDSTSDAVLVYTKSAPSAAVGDAVTVDATVTEFRPGGASGNDNLTTTQLTSPRVTVTASDEPLPAPVVIGKDRIAPQQTIETADPKNVESSAATFDPTKNAIDFDESLEGMRVSLRDARAVGPTNPKYRETPVVPGQNVTANATPRGGVLYSGYDHPNAMRIILDDQAKPANPLPLSTVGDVYSGTTTGIMDYSFAMPHLHVTDVEGHTSAGLQREQTKAPNLFEMAVATFNVENLAPSDPQTKYDRLAGQIVTNLRSPDVLTLEEIQDNNGAQNDGTVDSSTTVRKLVDTIKAAGGPSYQARWVNPEDSKDGGQPGGNIRQVFLYRTDRGTAFVDKGTATATSDTGVTGHGLFADVTQSPGRIDPTNPAFTDSRKPLVGEFTFRGTKVFVIANHFNSKGGDDPLFGRWQQPVRPSETQRYAQASVVRNFIDKLLAADPNARIVTLGDLNDFEFSQTADILVGGGKTALTDLPRTLATNERYSYVYEGNSQVLDHILLSPKLALPWLGLGKPPFSYDIVHTNSEFPDQDSDHDPQIVRMVVTPF